MNRTPLFVSSLLIATLAFAGFASDAAARGKAISRFPVPKVGSLPRDVRQMFAGAKKKRGFLPNVFRALAYRPAHLRAFMSYAQVVMGRKSGLSMAEKEMIVIATSGGNSCQYCVMAHGAKLRLLTKNPYLSDQLAVNYREADINPRQRAMLDFAMKVSKDSRAVSAADFKLLKRHGFSKRDIWDITSITAFFGLSNRMMNVAAVRPDKQNYSLGR